MAKKNEVKENEEKPFDILLVVMLLSLLFWEPPKESKVINIYMGDD
jgi:hypothetical protein